MADANSKLMIPSPKGFCKWEKTPPDDLPLIRPPHRHMLAQMTGGLQDLFARKREELKRNASSSSLSRNSATPSPSFCSNSDAFSKRSQKCDMLNVFKKKDDEGGGKIIEHNSIGGDTSQYTDKEGEFCPDSNMPLMAYRYKYVEVLARGQSALIVKALDTFDKDKAIAIKVLHKVYQPIGSQEADILLELHRSDPWLHVPFARLQNQFIYGPHYCLVFEYLSPTPLYIHYEQKSIKGPSSLKNIRTLCLKLLSVLGFLHKQNVIHADLKPENILLKDENDTSSVIVVDFGNALRNTEEELALYYSDYELQTLLYRAPEVIFGLHFSLPIDLWSLGCLLAECYSGQPLFLGKSKHDILSKITKLLGPFPSTFSKGECAKEFKEFIGQPWSCQSRIDNLRKKLDCKDINFLLLLESLLTYEPENRINPFEAAAHSFLAEIHPFLYMTSAGDSRYPQVLLRPNSYLHYPQQESFCDNAKKLLGYAKKCLRSKSADQNNFLTQGNRVSSSSLPIPNEKKKDTHALDKQIDSPKNSPESTTGHLDHPVPTEFLVKNSSIDTVKDSSKDSVMDSSEDPVMGSSKDPVMDSSKEPVMDPFNDQALKSTNDSSKDNVKDSSKDPANRTDFKQTLKSMGLRCEDFTISVYSTEQAHEILRKQGVEVTNHSAKPPKTPPEQSAAPSVSIKKQDSKIETPKTQEPDPPSEDDDDCVILEPPEGTKVPPPPKRYAQQYQLLGTTVLVNRSNKRPLIDLQNSVAKRLRANTKEDKSEISVQDTLKRLKNYNISITCRNAGPEVPVEKSTPEKPDVHSDSEDEDLARFLECQLNEVKSHVSPTKMDESETTLPVTNNTDDHMSNGKPATDLEATQDPLPDSSKETSEEQIDSSTKEAVPHEEPTSKEVEENNEKEEHNFTASPLDKVETFAEEEQELDAPINKKCDSDDEINDELERELLKISNVDKKYENEELQDECLGL